MLTGRVSMKALEHINSVDNNGLRWIDVSEPNRSTLNALADVYNLHPLNVEDCLSKIQVPKMDKYGSSIFIVMHYPLYSNGVPKNIQLSIFVGHNFLITVHKGEIKPIADLFNACKVDDMHRTSVMGNSSAFLLHKIIDAIIDELLHILIKIEGNIEDIEDLVFAENVSTIRIITEIRREILALRRIVLPLRRILADIARESQQFSSMDLAPYWNDVKDHLEKAIEVLDTANETINIYKDTDFILSTEKTNKILAILTIVFTLSIPATLIGTFYGMNVIIPGGVEDGPWMFLGKYTTFIVMVMLSIASALFMLYYFYKRGWLYEK
ncbi:MAG: magnesium transporter CorA family protein [Candidatus Nitrosocaldus sp.]|nr:magnesium transporter CorA family protein [Candidatus Nitrosocaldus sp.]MDW8000646.1 magnesium transporter CorA family protein [Candidatus Nitrosocaldus sp.]